jgi:hypothetical protein
VFSNLHKTLSSNHFRLSLMAWVLVFVCGQTLAANHLHLDNHASDEICVVCVHAQDHSITGNDSLHLTLSISHYTETTLHILFLQSSSPSSYFSRAPPKA